MSRRSVLRNEARAFLALFVTGLSGLLPAVAQVTSGCTILGTPQVSPTLVSLEIRPGVPSYRRGERISVTLTLRSGPEGVYLPDYFGSFLDTCRLGFSSEVLTQGGKAASTRQYGCASSGASPTVTYVKLGPAETRTWTTDLETESIAPGRYCLYAEYMSPGPDPALSSDQALLAVGRITALPLTIRIR